MFDFFGSKSYLGVDIGTTSIKIAEIYNDGKRPKLKNYGILETQGHLERMNSALQTGSMKLVDKDTADLILTLIKKSKFKTRDAVASIPAFSAFVTLIEMPQMPEAEIAKAMPFQIRQYIPMSVDEVAIDWMKIGEREASDGPKQQILLISIPKEEILKYQNIFKLAGLRLRALEVESLSLARALVGNDQVAGLIIDIGAYTTNILVIENGYLKASATTDFAGASLTQAIANGLGVDAKRAEELKKMRGLKATGGEYQLSTLPQPFLDVIIGEAVRLKDNFEKKYNKKIERVLLSGGGANLIGISEYFEKQISLPTAIGNSLSKVDYPKEIEIFSKELGSLLSVAVGLAIKK